jgi:hypothetical protein
MMFDLVVFAALVMWIFVLGAPKLKLRTFKVKRFANIIFQNYDLQGDATIELVLSCFYRSVGIRFEYYRDHRKKANLPLFDWRLFRKQKG